MEPRSNGRHGPHVLRRTRLVSVQSFRGGSGKSSVAANLAYLAARAGAKVAVVDADLQAPGLHRILGLEPGEVLHTVSEFVRGGCELSEVAIDVTRKLGLEHHEARLYALPASADLEATTAILFEGYDAARLNEGLPLLAQELDLDHVILDTHMGFNRETLLCLAICDTVIVLLRRDAQDREGAALLARIARKVGVPALVGLPNLVQPGEEAGDVRAQVESELGIEVGGVLPWCRELCARATPGLFAARNPEHPFTQELERIRQELLPTTAPAGGAA